MKTWVGEDPSVVSKGIPITVEVLKALGCKEENGGYEFKMHGYLFRFEPDSQHWNYIGPGAPSKMGHSATHLDEVFGFLAEDMHLAGQEFKLQELREFLGIKNESNLP